MNKRETGGPEFPVSTIDGFTNEGMSLRDYFAGQVLMGLCAYSGMAVGDDAEDTIKKRVQNAYAHADAMLEARK